MINAFRPGRWGGATAEMYRVHFVADCDFTGRSLTCSSTWSSTRSTHLYTRCSLSSSVPDGGCLRSKLSRFDRFFVQSYSRLCLAVTPLLVPTDETSVPFSLEKRTESTQTQECLAWGNHVGANVLVGWFSHKGFNSLGTISILSDFHDINM